MFSVKRRWHRKFVAIFMLLLITISLALKGTANTPDNKADSAGIGTANRASPQHASVQQERSVDAGSADIASVRSVDQSVRVASHAHLAGTVGVASVPASKPNNTVNIPFDSAQLYAPAMQITVNGVNLTLRRDRVAEHNGARFWAGHVEGEATSEVFFTHHGPSVSGVIRRGNTLYEMSATDGAQAVLVEVDHEHLPPEGEAERQLSADMPVNVAKLADSGSGTASGQIQDVMVAYTTAACDYFDRPIYGGNDDGDCSEIEAKIINAVNMANQAYLNSQDAIRAVSLPQLNLVHMVQTAYRESGSIGTSLDDVTFVGGNHAEMDELHALRDTYSADLVTLVTEDNDYCGMAWSLNGSADYGFSVVAAKCLSNQSYAHEVGHNQGNEHDRGNMVAGSAGYYNYSYGYSRCANDASGFRTIMAYPCKTGIGVRISHFSNPNVFYNGKATGVAENKANAAFAALSLRNTAAIVANFRSAAVDAAVPSAPANVVSTPRSSGKIDLTWIDTSDNESGFRIERSLDDHNWTEIASVSANVQSYSDDGLNAQTTYYYRVRAYNSTGNSAYSATTVTATSTSTAPSAGQKVAVVEYDVDGETNISGTVANNYLATRDDDGVVETIEEIVSARIRYNFLEHVWKFNQVAGGSTVTLFANAYSSGSKDGDAFNFAYSTDNETFTLMFTVSSTHADNMESFTLPANLDGPLYIRVTDTNQSRNKSARDSIYVDRLYIQAQP